MQAFGSIPDKAPDDFFGGVTFPEFHVLSSFDKMFSLFQFRLENSTRGRKPVIVVKVHGAAPINGARNMTMRAIPFDRTARPKLDRPSDDPPVGVAVPGDARWVISGVVQGLFDLTWVAALILVSGGD